MSGDGWVLVPRDATPDMIDMGAHAVERAQCGIDTDSAEDLAESVYESMITAAPTAGPGLSSPSTPVDSAGTG